MARLTLRFMCLLGVLPIVAPPARGEEKTLPRKQIVQRTLRSTALLAYRMPNGALMRGTGFVVDSRRKLLITNHHVVGKQDYVNVVFPMYRDGSLVAEFAEYQKSAT